MTEEEYFSDDSIKDRYRYWLMTKAESGETGFVPYEKDPKTGWCALPTLAQYEELEDMKAHADVIWSVESLKPPRWEGMALVYEREEGMAESSGGYHRGAK